MGSTDSVQQSVIGTGAGKYGAASVIVEDVVATGAGLCTNFLRTHFFIECDRRIIIDNCTFMIFNSNYVHAKLLEKVVLVMLRVPKLSMAPAPVA
jgi:hypothetical protein